MTGRTVTRHGVSWRYLYAGTWAAEVGGVEYRAVSSPGGRDLWWHLYRKGVKVPCGSGSSLKALSAELVKGGGK